MKKRSVKKHAKPHARPKKKDNYWQVVVLTVIIALIILFLIRSFLNVSVSLSPGENAVESESIMSTFLWFFAVPFAGIILVELVIYFFLTRS